MVELSQFSRHSTLRWHLRPRHGKKRHMISGLMGLLAAFFAASQDPTTDPRAEVRTMTIEQRLILRVPVSPRPRARISWVERQGPQCVPVGMLRGAYLAGEESIDFLLRNRRLVRARLDSDCGGLDFYGGFYLQPEDTMICAGRDVIRSRMGETCEIREFHLLVAQISRDR